ADQVTHDLTGNNDHGDGIHVCGGNAGNRVGCARAGCHQHGTHSTGRARIGIGHVGGGLFVAHQNVLDILLPENSVVDMQCSTARVAEDVFNTLVSQRAD